MCKLIYILILFLTEPNSGYPEGKFVDMNSGGSSAAYLGPQIWQEINHSNQVGVIPKSLFLFLLKGVNGKFKVIGE